MRDKLSNAVVVCLAAACFLVCGRASNAELTAGAAKRSIVPPFASPMGGYGARTKHFEGVHDEVLVRAVALDNGQAELILIGSDLTSLDAELTKRVRERVEEATGVPGGHIMVSCAHNHSAPSFYEPGRFRETDVPVKAFFVERFSEAAVAAHNSRVPATAGFAAGEIRGMTTNRQQNNELVDPQVGVLRVENKRSGETIATLFNFTGHPVVLGSDNLLLSGEYPGAACRAVENLMGGVAIFTQGAAGDVTMRRSGDPFHEIERIGRTLAGEVIKTAGFIRGTDDLQLAAASETLDLAPRSIPSVTEGERILKQANEALAAAKANHLKPAIIQAHQQKVRLHAMNVRIAKWLEDGTINPPDTYQAEVQLLRVGDLILVGIPGEIFVEYALEMRDRIRQVYDKPMCLVGYCNGYIGYIVTPRAQQTGGYEASVARVAAGSGRLLTETAVNLLPDVAQ